MKHPDTCTLYLDYCSQEKHTAYNEIGVFVCYWDGDWAKRHTQKLTTMPEMLISDALICDLDLKRVTNMLSATRVNTTRHWYAVAYGK